MKKKKQQKVQNFLVWCSRERVCDLSLDFRSFGLWVLAGAKGKVVLRNEGFAWAPVLRSFDKLREVWVLSYLFYP